MKKKLIVLFAGMAALCALLVSCEMDVRSERNDDAFILAYPDVAAERGRVDIESPRAYSVEVHEDGSLWVVLCDCGKDGGEPSEVRVILPTQNSSFDEAVKDRTRQAFYVYCFSDKEQGHVMFFNREV